jgi:hypothetical protein
MLYAWARLDGAEIFVKTRICAVRESGNFSII